MCGSSRRTAMENLLVPEFSWPWSDGDPPVKEGEKLTNRERKEGERQVGCYEGAKTLPESKAKSNLDLEPYGLGCQYVSPPLSCLTVRYTLGLLYR